MSDDPTMNKVAKGGTIHPIADAPVRDGERFGDVQLYPGIDWEWENGYYDGDLRAWFRRDHAPVHPTHWSPLAGQTIELAEPSPLSNDS